MKTAIDEILLLGVCATLLSGCCTQRVANRTWEYQIVDAEMFVPMMNAINQRAKDGWELMSVNPPPPNTTLSYAVMRRAKQY